MINDHSVVVANRTCCSRSGGGPPTVERRLLPRVLMGASAALLVLGGCGTDNDEGTQPATDVPSFEQGAFSDLPLPPRSEPVSERAEEAGVVSRSFAARDTSPEAVLEFYAQELDGAVVLAPPEEIGAGTRRGRWLLGDRELTVSATREDPLEAVERFGDDVGVVTQFSLSLSPRSAGE